MTRTEFINKYSGVSGLDNAMAVDLLLVITREIREYKDLLFANGDCE